MAVGKKVLISVLQQMLHLFFLCVSVHLDTIQSSLSVYNLNNKVTCLLYLTLFQLANWVIAQK